MCRWLIHTGIDGEASREWNDTLKNKIKDNLSEMEKSIQQLNNITVYSKVNQERLVKNLTLRHATVAPPEEHCTFPVKMIPRQQNADFYDRSEELERINRYLDYRGNDNLRTYQIYGRYVRLVEMIPYIMIPSPSIKYSFGLRAILYLR